MHLRLSLHRKARSSSSQPPKSASHPILNMPVDDENTDSEDPVAWVIYNYKNMFHNLAAPHRKLKVQMDNVMALASVPVSRAVIDAT